MTANSRKRSKAPYAANGPETGLPPSETKRTGTISDFIGCLAGKTTKVATLEEIQQAIEDGWAGLVHVGTDRRARRKKGATKRSSS